MTIAQYLALFCHIQLLRGVFIQEQGAIPNVYVRQHQSHFKEMGLERLGNEMHLENLRLLDPSICTTIPSPPTPNNRIVVVLAEVVGIINLQFSSIRPSLFYTEYFLKGMGK